MIELKNGVFLAGSKLLIDNEAELMDNVNQRLSKMNLEQISTSDMDKNLARTKTITYQILSKHNTQNDERNLKLKFDALASHDITYVGIVQTARASGLKEFPVPYVLTNCHNSLCAVGGTINEDDHVFGLSAAKKYGGIFVPTHQAVIHQYMREMMSGCGKMILGSDSHTRYGALGTMGIGEGGPELVKQLLGRTYDIVYPEVIAVYLDGCTVPGVGPQDVALTIIKAVFEKGFVKNKVLEFVGPGIASLSVDFRNGIDVMTTETTCLTSIWCTDEQVAAYYETHGRSQDYRKLEPGNLAFYDGAIKVDLSKIVPMIALPFHPSNVYSIEELNRHPKEILAKVEAEGQKQLENPQLSFRLIDKITKGRLKVEQGVVAGCSGGTFENITEMGVLLDKRSIGNEEFGLSVYPASQPIYLELVEQGTATKLLTAGVTIRSAFCGPCFGAGDVPANQAISIRHTTRNFPNREGSKPGDNQLASVALMDARSITATAINGGLLTPATEMNYQVSHIAYHFNQQIYDNRIYQGFGKSEPASPLKFGPNIADWPKMISLPQNLLLKVTAAIHDPVTTTDELIPSGETSSYRSNPLKLAEFTLSRKEPEYVKRAKAIQELESERRRLLAEGTFQEPYSTHLGSVFLPLVEAANPTPDMIHTLLKDTGLGSVIFAVKPGDGSAREQAASSQKVLGGWANIAYEYATKRYRSNLINWGMIPFIIPPGTINFGVGDFIFIPEIRQAMETGQTEVDALVVGTKGKQPIKLYLADLSPDDREIILKGCSMNYYAK